jgi:hypothetical protein
VLTVTPLAPAPLIVPFLLLCVPLRRRRSPTLLLLLLHCAAPLLPTVASALQPTLLDGTGTAAPTRGDRSLDHQLATEAAAQGKASGPGVESLQPRLLLQLRRLDVDRGCCKNRSECYTCCNGLYYTRMFLVYIPNVSFVLDICCKCFVWTLQN